MYFLRFRVLPAADHPEAERLGEGMVCCWVDRPTLDEADTLAQADIADQGWDILDREAAEAVTASDYEPDHEWLEYYQQSLTDGVVFVYHTSPRHPVYWVTVPVTQASPPETAAAHFFVCGEAVAADGDDVYDPAFWSSDRERSAINAAREAIEAEGWAVTGAVSGRPCGIRDLPEDLIEFYDEAEGDGSCLVFLRDGTPPAE